MLLFSGSGLALSVCFADSSPKGRAFGIARKLSVLPRPLPLGEVALREQ